MKGFKIPQPSPSPAKPFGSRSHSFLLASRSQQSCHSARCCVRSCCSLEHMPAWGLLVSSCASGSLCVCCSQTVPEDLGLHHLSLPGAQVLMSSCSWTQCDTDTLHFLLCSPDDALGIVWSTKNDGAGLFSKVWKQAPLCTAHGGSQKAVLSTQFHTLLRAAVNRCCPRVAISRKASEGLRSSFLAMQFENGKLAG